MNVGKVVSSPVVTKNLNATKRAKGLRNTLIAGAVAAGTLLGVALTKDAKQKDNVNNAQVELQVLVDKRC